MKPHAAALQHVQRFPTGNKSDLRARLVQQTTEKPADCAGTNDHNMHATDNRAVLRRRLGGKVDHVTKRN